MSSFDFDGPFRTVGIVPATTSETVLYTAPSAVTIGAVRAANVSLAAANVTLSWRDNSLGVTYALTSATPLAVGASLQIEIPAFRLRAGDTLRVTSSVASAICVMATLAELSSRIS